MPKSMGSHGKIELCPEIGALGFVYLVEKQLKIFDHHSLQLHMTCIWLAVMNDMFQDMGRMRANWAVFRIRLIICCMGFII